ncbi:MAG: hypothetical protein GY862_32560, partial [Gammaproteobacteria bacterium]|nr:hypothetical protein [Gammaproteobacteria bacterium]
MHSFDDLLNHLDRAGIVPAPDELADALWLARHMRMRQTEQADGLKEEKKALPRTESEQPPTDIPPPRKNPDSLSRRSEPERIYPKTMRGGGFSARAFRSPAIPMLPDRLNLDRSLRPLRRKVPSPSRLELDEEASVRHIAETGLWQPKLRGEPERCYNLMLLADWGESMRIWGPAIKELQRLLEREGRGLRTWYLDSDRYYPELYSGPDFAEARRCSPEEIFGSRGRHLLLLLSDCTACAWHSGGIFKLLALWGRRLPLALVQMLPDRLWAGTALGYAAMTHYHAVGPLSDNRRLYSDDCSPGADSLNLP